jgi:hypothetical protein
VANAIGTVYASAISLDEHHPIDAPQRACGWTSGKIGIPQGFGSLFEEENYTLRTGHSDSRMIAYPIK